MEPPPLRVVSLNLGYNVMANVQASSEKGFVKLCQEVYASQPPRHPITRLSQCTNNAVTLVSDYDLIFLQEANVNEWKLFEKALLEKGLAKGKEFKAVYNTGGVATVYDRKVLGSALSLTPPNFVFSDHRGTFKDYRGMQVLFFLDRSLATVNLHGPHGIELSPSITIALLYVINVWNGKYKPLDVQRIIMGGDFNDYLGTLLDPLTPKIKAFGLSLSVMKSKESSPTKTCCYDTSYKYPGDYILDSAPSKGKYLGHPPGYDRKIHLVSDHDPLVYVASL